ncbi:hypothetical protein CW751_02605 [Brumimicrobium salinarum]|uniref:DUF177 domain-containing protein n=1 Tax=Brumimicrobium salinarum TaxID=2058658 RepID=A0A2I0R6M8_9FLAO|nr:DUF177 domain-containing protein [Brumimicrobium salinarum]PKR82242.1 hypothetical protein CW751_02605 [Brumimicrobium salinarum]
MSSNKDFIIQFEGLKNGKHHFQYQITNKFFEDLTYSIIQGGNVNVDFQLNKKDTMLIGDIEMSGSIQKPCDRCTDLMEIPIQITHQIIYKFGADESGDENLIVLPISAFTIDISKPLYEILTVSIPGRAVHDEENCNEEMLDLLDKYVDSSENEVAENDSDIDPRWAALKKLN